jgi:branched-chain amino acid transport system substrate-binding protein
VSRALSGARFDAKHLGGFHNATMRASDHQLQQPLVVSVMDRAGAPGVKHDVEGSGFGFRTVRRFEATEVEMPTSCKMVKVE